MPFNSKLPDITIPTNISLPEFIIQNFKYIPKDKKILIDPFSQRSYTPPQAIHAINKVAAGFHKRGLKQGDVVALYLPNLIDYPILMYGIQSIGAIPSTFNPLYTVEEITHQLKDCGAKYIITIPQLIDKVAGAIFHLETQIKEVLYFGDIQEVKMPDVDSLATTARFKSSPISSLLNNDGKYPVVKIDPLTTIAVIPYSSGTTGLSKGVELTHYNILANILQIIAIHDGIYSDNEVLVAFLPFFHIYGMVVLMGVALRQGFQLVVLPKFELSNYLKFIQEYKATTLHVVPPVVVLLNKDPSVLSFNLKSVRTVISGAAPLGADTEAELKERLPGIKMIQAYGMTEMSPVTHSNTARVQAPGSIGQLLPNMKFKVVDVETGKELGHKQTGELVVYGPNRMVGYLHNEKATKNTIDEDGFLHTGDIVYMDEEENCYVVDRLKELIKYKGFQVAPAELEAILLSHPDIADVAVIGKPDLEAGELPMAFVVLKPGAKITGSEIISWAEKKSAPHKKLRGGVVMIDVIPKSASGKILRRVLKADLQKIQKIQDDVQKIQKTQAQTLQARL